MGGVFIHPSAVIDDDVVIGEGTKVWHFVHVSQGARIGRDCVLGQNVFIGRGVRLGNRVRVQNNVSVYEGVEVEDEVFLGPSCVFTNVRNPRAFVERKHAFEPTRVGRGASVGANATVVCGRDLGEYCFIGAGCVVVRGARPYELLVGNPARRLGYVCVCGERLAGEPHATCGACRRNYAIDNAGCRLTDA